MFSDSKYELLLLMKYGKTGVLLFSRSLIMDHSALCPTVVAEDYLLTCLEGYLTSMNPR